MSESNIKKHCQLFERKKGESPSDEKRPEHFTTSNNKKNNTTKVDLSTQDLDSFSTSLSSVKHEHACPNTKMMIIGSVGMIMCKRPGGSVGRASDSRSKDPRFEPHLRQEHKKHL